MLHGEAQAQEGVNAKAVVNDYDARPCGELIKQQGRTMSTEQQL